MKRLCGGIDVGSEHHHVIIMDDKEKIFYDREIAQTYSDFHEAIEEFREIGWRGWCGWCQVSILQENLKNGDTIYKLKKPSVVLVQSPTPW